MRRFTRDEQRVALQAICKELGGSVYAQQRMADLLDMHLTRRGLCVVTIEERNLLPPPSAMDSAAAESS